MHSEIQDVQRTLYMICSKICTLFDIFAIIAGKKNLTKGHYKYNFLVVNVNVLKIMIMLMIIDATKASRYKLSFLDYLYYHDGLVYLTFHYKRECKKCQDSCKSICRSFLAFLPYIVLNTEHSWEL